MRRISLSQLYFTGREPDYSLFSGTLFTDIELRADNLLSTGRNDIAENIMKELEKAGIGAKSMHAPFSDTDISVDDEWYRVRSVREIEKACILLSKLGGNYLIVHPSMKQDGRYRRSFDRLFKSLNEIRDTAEGLNCELLLENTLPGRLGSTEEDTDKLISEGYSLCFDTGHAMLSGIGLENYFEKYRGRIKAVHIHENDGSGDTHRMVESAKMKELASKIISSSDEDAVCVFEVYENGMSVKALSSSVEELL